MAGRGMFSTGARLTAAIALAVLLISALGLGVQYTLVKRDLGARLNQLLAADMAGFAALYDQRRVIAVRQAIEFRKLGHPGGDLLAALQDRHGGVLAETGGDWPLHIAQPAEGQQGPPTRFTHDGVEYLGMARTLAGGFPLWLARSMAPMQQTLADMRRIFLAVVVAIALAGLVAGYLASRWILRRISAINRLADRVAAGDLAARLPGLRARDEFGLLETHFHAMLDRIEALHRATNHLSDTIAHELRTPLTRIQARLARLGNVDCDTREVMQEIRDTIRIFDSLLEITRAQASVGDRTGPAMLDLSALLGELFELYEPLAEQRGIGFAGNIDPGVMILGDRNLIALAISNLFENALKFTPKGGQVTVSLGLGQAHHVLQVADNGPGLPPGFETEIFERFTRATGDAAVPGHGLGLALVRAVALRHGARLSLPDTGKGFVIEIAWPSIRPE